MAEQIWFKTQVFFKEKVPSAFAPRLVVDHRAKIVIIWFSETILVALLKLK